MNQLKSIANNQIKAIIFDFDGVLSSYYVRVAGPIINSVKRFVPDITQEQIEEGTLLILSKMNASNNELHKKDILKLAFSMGKEMGLSNIQALKYLLV